MALDALELKRTAAHATGPLAQRIVDLDVTTGSGLAAAWSTCEKRHVKPYSKLGNVCVVGERMRDATAAITRLERHAGDGAVGDAWYRVPACAIF